MSENNIDSPVKLDLPLEIWLVRKTLEERNQLLFDQNELLGHIFDVLRNNFGWPAKPRTNCPHDECDPGRG